MKLIDTKVTVMDLTIPTTSIDQELTRFWVPKDAKLVSVRIRNYMRVLKRGFQYLAYRHDRSRAELERLCAHVGASHLYSFEGVAEIRQAKRHLIENGGANADALYALENRHFDLKTSDFVNYTGRILEEDMAQIAGFADLVGITKGLAYQITVSHLLLQSFLPDHIHNQLAKVFIRFRYSMESWGRHAIRVMNGCEIDRGKERIPLEDIYL